MVNYTNAKIYRIVCNTTGLQYIGSTTRPLSERLNEHKKKYKLYTDHKYGFVSSFEILKNNNYEIILIENVPCNNKEELHRRERFYIESLSCVNIVIPQRTRKEYYEDNKEEISEQKKEYNEMNKDKIKERNKQYYEANKQEISEQHKQYNEMNKDKISENKKKYREANKEYLQEYHKQYNDMNKDKISEQNKQYYEVNKQKISERKMKPFQCPCGSVLTIRHKSRHLKCKKHLAYLESLKETN